jgi:LPXTG-motif cell wall-anchored protein
VLISNLGSYRIDNVDVEISSDVLESLDITNKQYIGSLENDDFSTVQFKTQISPFTVPGEYDMTVKVTYRDQSGEWKTRYMTQPLTIYAAQTGNGGNALLYGGVFILLVVAVWYFFLRKKPKA